MDIFSVFTLCGGLAFFLYGMNTMSKSLEKMAGGRLERTLKRMTDNPFKSLALGAGITIAIQSSSAMTVMLVGLVNSGVMQLGQTIGVIMGSNIGTTLTAWILAMSGIQSENVFVNLLKPENFSPLIALVGIILIMGSKKQKRRDIGRIMPVKKPRVRSSTGANSATGRHRIPASKAPSPIRRCCLILNPLQNMAYSSSSKIKISSIRLSNVSAILWASRMDGLYFPLSSEMMVWRDTPSRSASACWVIPRVRRSSSILFFKGSLLFKPVVRRRLFCVKFALQSEHTTSQSKCQAPFTIYFCGLCPVAFPWGIWYTENAANRK